MLNDGTRIDLVTRLRRMSGVLDILVPESPSAALEACGLAEAITLLEKDGARRWSRSIGQLCMAAFGTMQNDSGGMNTCFSIGWRCFRSTVDVPTKRLNSGPRLRRSIVPKEG